MSIPTLFRRGYIFKRGGMSKNKTAGTWTKDRSGGLFIRCANCTRILDISSYNFTDAANADSIVKYARSCSHCYCGFVFNFALTGYEKPDPEAVKLFKFIQKKMLGAGEPSFYSICSSASGNVSISVTCTDQARMLTISGHGPYYLGATGRENDDSAKFETVKQAIEQGIRTIAKKI